MGKKLTLKYAQQLAKKHKGKCLSTEYVNARTPMKWQCDKKHIWPAPLGRISNNHWCPICSGKKKHTLQDCIDYAHKYNGGCLSKHYNYKGKQKWQCEKGHIWKARFNVMSGRNTWCYVCYLNNLVEKNTIRISNEINKVVKKYKAKILVGYINWKTKLTILCKNGHIFKTTPSNLLSTNKSWCKECFVEKERCGLGVVKEIVESRGGKCLENKYINYCTKMKISCELGHEWKTSLQKLRIGRWCPICSHADGRKSRELMYNILKNIFPDYTILVNYRGLDWLRGKRNSKMELDFYIFNKDKSFTLGIEYDGKQHFQPVKKFGGKQGLKETKQRDCRKTKLIKQHPEDVKHFVRFNYKEKLTEEYIIKKLFRCCKITQ